jgi:hypothetical protein
VARTKRVFGPTLLGTRDDPRAPAPVPNLGGPMAVSTISSETYEPIVQNSVLQDIDWDFAVTCENILAHWLTSTPCRSDSSLSLACAYRTPGQSAPRRSCCVSAERCFMIWAHPSAYPPGGQARGSEYLQLGYKSHFSPCRKMFRGVAPQLLPLPPTFSQTLNESYIASKSD